MLRVTAQVLSPPGASAEGAPRVDQDEDRIEPEPANQDVTDRAPQHQSEQASDSAAELARLYERVLREESAIEQLLVSRSSELERSLQQQTMHRSRSEELVAAETERVERRAAQEGAQLGDTESENMHARLQSLEESMSADKELQLADSELEERLKRQVELEIEAEYHRRKQQLMHKYGHDQHETKSRVVLHTQSND